VIRSLFFVDTFVGLIYNHIIVNINDNVED